MQPTFTPPTLPDMDTDESVPVWFDYAFSIVERMEHAYEHVTHVCNVHAVHMPSMDEHYVRDCMWAFLESTDAAQEDCYGQWDPRPSIERAMYHAAAAARRIAPYRSRPHARVAAWLQHAADVAGNGLAVLNGTMTAEDFTEWERADTDRLAVLAYA